MGLDPPLDGSFIFGTACNVIHAPIPNQAQEDSYFGITGVTRIDGGGRGRLFHVHGVFVAADLASIAAAEATLLSYADGITRTFTDTYGRSWSNTVFTGDYHPDPGGPRFVGGGGWSLRYQCTLRCLG